MSHVLLIIISEFYLGNVKLARYLNNILRGWEGEERGCQAMSSSIQSHKGIPTWNVQKTCLREEGGREGRTGGGEGSDGRDQRMRNFLRYFLKPFIFQLQGLQRLLTFKLLPCVMFKTSF